MFVEPLILSCNKRFQNFSVEFLSKRRVFYYCVVERKGESLNRSCYQSG